jgi:hypothetical protein
MSAHEIYNVLFLACGAKNQLDSIGQTSASNDNDAQY